MATRETRLHRSRHRAQELAARLAREIRTARFSANASQRAMARELGWSASRYRRFESDSSGNASILELSEIAAVLGMELGAGLHPVGDGLVDRGHRAVIARFRSELGEAWRVAAEVPLALAGDQRSWDLLLRIPEQLVGVEAETRVRDEQALVRHVRMRERDGGADVILVVLSDSAHNRALASDLRRTLGSSYATSPRRILAALRSGRPIPGCGVILV